MFVYLLREARQPRFKIGKANDIHQRIASIGGSKAFDLDASFCVRFPTSSDALRVEKILHRLFAHANLGPSSTGRRPGDTEIFDLKYLDRVLKFLTDNPDLLAGAAPEPLPPPQRPVKMPTVPTAPPLTRAERELRAEQASILQFDTAIPLLSAALTELLAAPNVDFLLALNADDDDPGWPELMARTHSKEAFECVGAIAKNLFEIAFPPTRGGAGRTRAVTSFSARWCDPRGVCALCTNARFFSQSAEVEFPAIHDCLQEIPRYRIDQERPFASIFDPDPAQEALVEAWDDALWAKFDHASKPCIG